MEQRTGYLTAADGTRICYAICGSGPVILRAANWLTHVEFDLENPM